MHMSIGKSEQKAEAAKENEETRLIKRRSDAICGYLELLYKSQAAR